MKIIIATVKTWNIEKAQELQRKNLGKHEIQIIERREDLKADWLLLFKPDFIFFPHWSYMIPEYVYEKYNCVVFHMTDLPFGRGGSPLQNLIVRGIKDTKLSAIKVVREVDAGPVYLKEPLSLSGSAEEIYRRASDVIFDKMIPAFLNGNLLIPKEQQGPPVYFKRRTAEQSELKEEMSLSQIYDYIRMLDAEGYPNAYLVFGKYRIKLRNAKLNSGRIHAEADIIMEEEE